MILTSTRHSSLDQVHSLFALHSLCDAAGGSSGDVNRARIAILEILLSNLDGADVNLSHLLLGACAQKQATLQGADSC